MNEAHRTLGERLQVRPKGISSQRRPDSIDALGCFDVPSGRNVFGKQVNVGLLVIARNVVKFHELEIRTVTDV
jgi:hypothetical protein